MPHPWSVLGGQTLCLPRSWVQDQKYCLMTQENTDARLVRTKRTDPFAGVGFSNYPACRLATGLEPEASGPEKPFSPEDSARLERMKLPHRRQEMAASFTLLRMLIGDLTGCSPEDVKLATSEDGAPKLENPSGWSLSLANKGATTVIAMDPAPADIGVDLEFVRALDWYAILKIVSTEAEREAFRQVYAERSDCVEAFLRLWTIKEAVLKATQRGFRAGPKAIETPPSILDRSGQGQISAFGERYDFWTVLSGDALISLARKRN